MNYIVPDALDWILRERPEFGGGPARVKGPPPGTLDADAIAALGEQIVNLAQHVSRMEIELRKLVVRYEDAQRARDFGPSGSDADTDAA